jgi:hypothetical protein
MTIPLPLYFFYEDATNKDGETGLTVNVDVWRRTKADGTTSEIVTAGSATEIGDGLYVYNVTGADPTLYDYIAVFKSTSADVVSKHVPAIRWDGAEGGVGVNSISANAITAASIATDAGAGNAVRPPTLRLSTGAGTLGGALQPAKSARASPPSQRRET